MATEADFAMSRASYTRTENTESDQGANMKKRTKTQMTVTGSHTRIYLKCRTIAASVVIGLGLFFTGGSTGSTPSNP